MNIILLKESEGPYLLESLKVTEKHVIWLKDLHCWVPSIFSGLLQTALPGFAGPSMIGGGILVLIESSVCCLISNTDVSYCTTPRIFEDVDRLHLAS